MGTPHVAPFYRKTRGEKGDERQGFASIGIYMERIFWTGPLMNSGLLPYLLQAVCNALQYDFRTIFGKGSHCVSIIYHFAFFSVSYMFLLFASDFCPIPHLCYTDARNLWASAIERNQVLTHPTWENLEKMAKWRKPITKDQMVSDAIYLKFPGEANP